MLIVKWERFCCGVCEILSGICNWMFIMFLVYCFVRLGRLLIGNENWLVIFLCLFVVRFLVYVYVVFVEKWCNDLFNVRIVM